MSYVSESGKDKDRANALKLWEAWLEQVQSPLGCAARSHRHTHTRLLCVEQSFMDREALRVAFDLMYKALPELSIDAPRAPQHVTDFLVAFITKDVLPLSYCQRAFGGSSELVASGDGAKYLGKLLEALLKQESVGDIEELKAMFVAAELDPMKFFEVSGERADNWR